MSALHQVIDWPVDHVAAAIVTDDGVDQIGDPDRPYRLASLSKPIAAWAIMIAVEETVIDLDRALQHVVAPEGATMRHLLSHAAGFGFDGEEPVAAIERRRMYSNTGIERAADELAGAAGMRYGRFLAASLVGTAAWSAVFILLGYALSRSLERAEDAASVVGLAVGALVAAWVIRNAVRRRRRRLG